MEKLGGGEQYIFAEARIPAKARVSRRELGCEKNSLQLEPIDYDKISVQLFGQKIKMCLVQKN